MTTQSWSSIVAHTNDADFRAWGSELAAKFAAAGLVQSGDTGQINWTTVARPGASVDAGYEIYYLNDSLHGSAPIYVKVTYGTGSNASGPNIKIQTGTASNGSGTLSGVGVTQAAVCSGGAPLSTSTAYQSYLCVTAGFIGLVWKYGARSAPNVAMAGFFIARTVNSSGAPTGSGMFFMNGSTVNGSSVMATQSIRFAATAIAYTLTSAKEQCIVPGAQNNSAVGSDVQLYLHWMLTPQVTPVLALAAAFQTEVTPGSTVAATLIGVTSHTYISVGNSCGYSWLANSPSLLGLCMLWE